jgi:trypsin
LLPRIRFPTNKLRLFLAPVALAFGATACSAPALEDPPAVQRQRIIGGVASPASDDAVLLVLTNRGVPSVCSCALVAPNLIVTARHCISAEYPADNIRCASDGTVIMPSGGALGAPVTGDKISLFSGADVPAAAALPSGTVVAQGLQVITGDGPSVCRDDLALVVLDRALDQAPVKLGIGLSVTQATQVSVIGYGLTETTDPNAIFSTRHRRDNVPVKYVGILPDTFTVGRSVCKGDSGGPALDSVTGALVGAYSLGFPGKNTTDCSSEEAINYFVDVTHYDALLRQGFAAAGQPYPDPIVDAGAADADADAADAADDAPTDDAGDMDGGGSGGQATQVAGAAGSKSSGATSSACQVRGIGGSSSWSGLILSAAAIAAVRLRRRKGQCA